MRITCKPLTHPLDAPRPGLWIRAVVRRRGLTVWGRSWVIPLPALLRRRGDRRPRFSRKPAPLHHHGLEHGESQVGALLFWAAVIALAWLWSVAGNPLR